MKILALETSGFSGEVALLENDQLVVEQALASEQRTAQSLAPAIAAALAQAGWKPRDVQLVAVTIGPGSFTGLRVGATTAKTFAYAAECEVLGVDTLAVIAAQIEPLEERELWSVLDAQRSQLFAARYVGKSSQWHNLSPAAIIDNERWLAELSPTALVTGSGLKKLLARLPASAITPESTWSPRATSVGQLAFRDYTAGRRDNLWTLAPHYLRASAAEEKAADQAVSRTPSP
jgi:tRNA threonylcarbamoyladenosine biosynthesis protein TsaB